MSEQRIYPLLEAITTKIKGHLTELKSCEVHEGKMTLPRLLSIARKAPAVHVALLDMPTTLTASKATKTELTLVAYITTRDQPRLPSAKSSLNLTEHLTRWIPNQNWCVPYAYPANKVAARNLWTMDMDKSGVSLWAITWKQTIVLPKLNSKESPLAKNLYFDDGHDQIVMGVSPDE